MRHSKFPIAIAIGLAVAVAAGGTVSAKSTQKAKPAAATNQAKLMAAHRGGTLKLLAKAAGGTLDPQINYTLQYWQLYRSTQDGLVAFKAAGGDEAFKIVPDLAVAIPKPTDGGKTWTFTLRKGIKYSNGKPVTARDVLWTMQRVFKVSGPTAGSFYSVLVGADKCIATPATCDLSKAVVVNAKKNTVTFHLVQPDAEWLDKLAVPHASLLPWGTQNKDFGTKLPPSTGAYMFTKYDPNHELVMKRNPNYKQWSADAQPDGYADTITYSFGQTVEAQITQIENGTADWTLESPPADRLNEIGTKYAAQAHINTQLANWYLPMNTNLKPFTSKLARQAVNYAIDRSQAVRILGGPKLAIPSCQILPAGFPARVDYCPYTKNPGAKWSAPDLAKAKSLVKQSGMAGQPVAVTSSNDEVNKAMGVYVQSVLNSIGYKASVKAISVNIFFTYAQNTKNKVQINVQQWYQDYPAA
ncbi:MAG: peptide/nickel transport system substrate-binding protein, partial [Gaiellales bacterium]|nr:peptide/nickel transport system substrate-binding protein [Gaiellales bacterium]